MSARWRRTRAVRGGQQPGPARARTPDPQEPFPSGGDASEAALPDSLADLLDDMLELRLTLVADLSAAAAAVDADSDRVAADIIDGDRRELAAFLRRGRSYLQTPVGAVAAPVADVPASRSWRRRALVSLPAVPLVGALAMSAAAAAGLLPLPTQTHHHRHGAVVAAAPVASTFQQFESVVDSDPSASQVVAAASALHQQIAAMLATAPQNPTRVTEVAQLLQLEQALLLRKQPPGSNLVLAQSRRLAARLLTIARASQPTPASVPTASPKPASSTSPKPAASTSPAAKTSPTTTSHTSSPSPSSSPSSTDGPGHLPTIGG